MVVVVIPLHRCVLDRAVHPFDLAIRPWMIWLGQPVLDPIGCANHVETHGSGIGCVPVSGLLCELDAVVCQDPVNLIGHALQQVLKELPCCLAVCLFDQLCNSELAGAVNGDKEMQLAFLTPASLV